MAEQQQQQPLQSPFPIPPPFYAHFTKSNLAQLRQLRKEAITSQQSTATNDSSKPEPDILPLPPILRYLIPPEPPANGQWNSFGGSLSTTDAQPTLSESGIEQLYPSHPSTFLNPAPHLLALARSLLTTFLALTGILSADPTLYGVKVDDLQTIMYNMHDLINQYRPHQARESLILMMEERIERMRDEVGKIREGKAKVGKLMGVLRESADVQVKREDGGEMEGRVQMVDENWKVRQRRMWAAMEKEVASEDG